MKICVYGASGSALDPKYYEAAEELGRLIGRGGHALIFGGGAGGLMGACAKGAAAAGGEVVGIAPRFFDEPGVLYDGCTRFHFTETMSERKALMEELSEAFIALPGGIGTFEEFFETLTLKQLGRHGKPMALLNTLNYFAPLMRLLEKAAEGRFLSARCFSLFSLCETPTEVLESVLSAPIVSGDLRRLSDYAK